MKRLWNGVLRLKIPIGVCILGAFLWGLKESLQTASLLLFFIGLSMILGHLAGKELFRGYKWDVGKRLNQAWTYAASREAEAIRGISLSLLAVGMLMARVLIYIAVVVAMAILTAFLLRGTAFGVTPSIPQGSGVNGNHPIPARAVPLLPVLQEEHARIWPESDICIIAGQIQVESAWRETAKRVEPNGWTSYGLLQVLDRTFLEMRSRNKTLADIEPVQMLQARYGIRAGIIYDRMMWMRALCPESDSLRWHYALREYNGGRKLLADEIKRAGTCDPARVDAECKRKVIKLKKGVLDLCTVNTRYPRDIFKFAESYRGRL